LYSEEKNNETSIKERRLMGFDSRGKKDASGTFVIIFIIFWLFVQFNLLVHQKDGQRRVSLKVNASTNMTLMLEIRFSGCFFTFDQKARAQRKGMKKCEGTRKEGRT